MSLLEPHEKVAIGIFVFVVSLVLAITFIQPYFEARAFNRFSKTQATYFDALVLDLRVIPDHD